MNDTPNLLTDTELAAITSGARLPVLHLDTGEWERVRTNYGTHFRPCDPDTDRDQRRENDR